MGQLIKSHSASLVFQRIPARYLSLAGITFLASLAWTSSRILLQQNLHRAPLARSTLGMAGIRGGSDKDLKSKSRLQTAGIDPMYGPAVRRKRDRRAWLSGLAQMYPASDWSSLLRATMDISARAIFLPDRPRRGAIRVTSVRRRREDRPPSLRSSRRPRRVRMLLGSHRPVPLFVPGAVPQFRPANPLLRRAQARSRPARSAARLGLDAAE